MPRKTGAPERSPELTSATRGSFPGKRLVDLAVVVLAAVPAALVGLIIAMAIRLGSPGPAVLAIPRVGRGGVMFGMLKFRTTVDLTDDHPPLDDPRTTTVGRWVRRLSLDELPQLLNVARGEMGIVGPRPTSDETVSRYTDDQWRRVSVRPGVTGLAQVSGRNHLDWSERLAVDLAYLDAQSPREDLRIILATGRAAVAGHGAELPEDRDTSGYWLGPSERDEHGETG